MLTLRVLVLALLALALTAVPVTAQQKEVVIGIMYPLSGPSASAGVDDKHVFELFTDMVNGKEPMLPGAFHQKLKGLSGFPGGARLRLTLLDAINRAGSTEPEAIRRALTQTDIKPADLIMPWNGVKFDETGQNVGVRAIVMQLQGGKYYTVWPFDMATRDVIYPIPRWSERR